MGKKSRTKARSCASPHRGIGPRQPCPCGSGRRYKACHGSCRRCGAVRRAHLRGPARRVRLGRAARVRACRHRAAHAVEPAPSTVQPTDRVSMVASVLPGIAPALGATTARSGSPPRSPTSRPTRAATSAEALRLGLAAARGRVGRDDRAADGPGPRLQDVVDADSDFDGRRARRLRLLVRRRRRRRRHGRGHPREPQRVDRPDSSRLASVDAAYWTVGRHARSTCAGCMPHDEEALLTALARLHAAGADAAARPTHGWSARSAPTGCWSRSGTCRSAPGPRRSRSRPPPFGARLDEALADSAPLTRAERSARHGLATRQLTIR